MIAAMNDDAHHKKEEEMKAARKARIESYRQDLHDLLVKRDLIKKDALKELETQKITHLSSQLKS